MNSIFKISASSAYFATVSGLRIPSDSAASFVQMDSQDLRELAYMLQVHDPVANEKIRQGLRAFLDGRGPVPQFGPQFGLGPPPQRVVPVATPYGQEQTPASAAKLRPAPASKTYTDVSKIGSKENGDEIVQGILAGRGLVLQGLQAKDLNGQHGKVEQKH